MSKCTMNKHHVQQNLIKITFFSPNILRKKNYLATYMYQKTPKFVSHVTMVMANKLISSAVYTKNQWL